MLLFVQLTNPLHDGNPVFYLWMCHNEGLAPVNGQGYDQGHYHLKHYVSLIWWEAQEIVHWKDNLLSL